MMCATDLNVVCLFLHIKHCRYSLPQSCLLNYERLGLMDLGDFHRHIPISPDDLHYLLCHFTFSQVLANSNFLSNFKTKAPLVKGN